MKKFIAVIGLVAGVSAYAGGSSTAGTGNPASQLCEGTGGTALTLEGAGGQSAFCAFGSAMIDSWALWRARHGDQDLAVKHYFNSRYVPRPGAALPNPSAAHCVSLGGSYVTLGIANRPEQYSICVFEDNSAIEAWTLFRGADHPSSLALTRALRDSEDGGPSPTPSPSPSGYPNPTPSPAPSLIPNF